MKKCASKGCETQIANTLLMCGRHWAKVTVGTQAKVYRTARAYQRVDVRADNFHDVRRDYYDAAKKACQEVGEQLVNEKARKCPHCRRTIGTSAADEFVGRCYCRELEADERGDGFEY